MSPIFLVLPFASFLEFAWEMSDSIAGNLVKSLKGGVLAGRIRAEVRVLCEEIKNGN